MNNLLFYPFPTLSDDSAQNMMASFQNFVREETGLHVGVRHEPLATLGCSFSCFIVSVTAEATAAQKAEINYGANEIFEFFCYEEDMTEDWPYPMLNHVFMSEDGFRNRMDWKSEDWRSTVWKFEE